MNPVDAAMVAIEKHANSGLMGYSAQAAPGLASRMITPELKSKFMGGAASALGTAASGAALALGTAAVTGLGYGMHKLVDAVQKKQQFNSMLESNPDLRELQSRDPRLFNTAYTSLRTLNPSYGADPIVAGTIMRRVMDSPASAGGVLMSTLSSPKPRESLMSVNAGPFQLKAPV